MYKAITDDLRNAYDQKVAERESNETQAWKVEIRKQFLGLLRAEGESRLLEVGDLHGVLTAMHF